MIHILKIIEGIFCYGTILLYYFIASIEWAMKSPIDEGWIESFKGFVK